MRAGLPCTHAETSAQSPVLIYLLGGVGTGIPKELVGEDELDLARVRVFVPPDGRGRVRVVVLEGREEEREDVVAVLVLDERERRAEAHVRRRRDKDHVARPPRVDAVARGVLPVDAVLGPREGEAVLDLEEVRRPDQKVDARSRFEDERVLRAAVGPVPDGPRIAGRRADPGAEDAVVRVTLARVPAAPVERPEPLRRIRRDRAAVRGRERADGVLDDALGEGAVVAARLERAGEAPRVAPVLRRGADMIDRAKDEGNESKPR